MRKPRKNHQIPRGKDLNTKGKPSDPDGERIDQLNGKPSESHEGMKESSVTCSQHDEPTHYEKKKHLKPVCLAIARLRRTESTALAMKESHLFPT